MARTVQAVLNRAAEVLNDVAFVRYTQAELLQHVVDAVTLARSVRPDLFVGQYATPLPDTLAVGDTLPLPDQFFAPLALYVAGMAELRDDEFAVDGRAMTISQALSKKLVAGM